MRRERAVRDELAAVIDLAFDRAPYITVGLAGLLRHVPLRIHGRYQQEEVLVALDHSSLDRKPNSFREGVLYVPDLDVDAFFVTLQKSEADFSPTTLYRDYPISPTLFHWATQLVTTVASPTGERYLNSTSTKLLFVRQHKTDDLGTSPYLFAGPARYVHHTGERPIAITWKLDRPLPNDVFAAATVAS